MSPGTSRPALTLRTRLLLAFLALALVPTAVLTSFTLDRLGRALELWNTPGVDRALESALETGKTSLARMSGTVLAQADEYAAALPHEPLTPPRRAALQAGLRATGLDFIQLYTRRDGRWVLAEEVRPEGVLAVTPMDLSTELDPELVERVIHSSRGVLAGAAPMGKDYALVAGMLLQPDYFESIERVGRGVSFYRRFGVVRDVSRAYMLLLVVLLVALLAAAAVWASTVLAAGLTRPLTRLERALENVAAGDLTVRIEPQGPREVAALSERFNTMTERLSEARDALQRAEREAAWREVARRLAHEFKNLLTPMSLSLHRLRRRTGAVTDEHRVAVSESLAALASGVDQMTRLSEQFSQYARLPEPRFETVDLDDVVRSAVALHEHEGVTVKVANPVGAVNVQGDSLLLSRAVHNLILNACEASPAGSQVQVRTAVEDGQAVVEVLDRGPGLDPAVRARLFEPYVSTKRRGSGLGLSLVRDVATQHGGLVTLEDRAGGGAVARFAMPEWVSQGSREKGII
jgi:nitrogen fixation/metabolism regulation signal transduction histidine kinase